MVLALLLALAAIAPSASLAPQDDVCAELRTILPDLRRIDRMVNGRGPGHVVSDARVRVLEERLGEYLGLPSGLRVNLTTISGHRREVAKNGSITAWIEHRESGTALDYARIAWTGESVAVSSLRFQDGESPGAFPRASLPVFYARLGELLELVDPALYAIEGISFFSGSTKGDTPGFKATLGIRVPGELGEKFLWVPAILPLEEGAPVFTGPAKRRVDVRDAVDVGLELLADLEFDFPHSMQLWHSLLEPLVYELSLAPYKKAQPPFPARARIYRAEPDAGWTVTDTRAEGEPPGVELGAFVALANRVQALLVKDGTRMAVLGLARSELPEAARALLVTVDAKSIWSAEEGRVYVVSVDQAGETSVVERSELPEILMGEPAGNVREGVSTTGAAFHLFVPVRGDVFMRNPPPRVLRYGGRAFVPVGGRLSD